MNFYFAICWSNGYYETCWKIEYIKWCYLMFKISGMHCTDGNSWSYCMIIQISDAIEYEKVVKKTCKIYNVDRAVCGRIAGVIAKKYGDTGFAGQLNIT